MAKPKTAKKPDAAKTAVFLYSKGYNCAKCVYYALRISHGRKPDPKVLKLCAAFGGGLGRSGSICGALIGAQFALAERTGTTGLDNPNSEAYKSARRLFKRFSNCFGAVTCKELNRCDFTSLAHFKRCSKIVSKSAQFADKLL